MVEETARSKKSKGYGFPNAISGKEGIAGIVQRAEWFRV